MTINNYHYLRPEIVPMLSSDDLFTKAEQQPTRYSYAEAILELGEKNPKVVVLDADVSKSIKTNEFADKFPDRSFNFGIAEQNMMAAAAGMATTGLIPFATTYAVFASMRALDQVRNSIHYPKLNVKIAAGHSGITPGPDGVTHQAGDTLIVAADTGEILGEDILGAGKKRAGIVTTATIAGAVRTVLLGHDFLNYLEGGIHGRPPMCTDRPFVIDLFVAAVGAAALAAR